MKIQSLMLAVALAASGAAFAAAPNDTGTAPAYPATTSSTTVSKNGTMGDKVEAGAHKTRHAAKKMHAKARHGAHRMHASAKRHMHHDAHASAKHHAHHDTHAMGAGPSSPSTDLNASTRQARIDQAYADWKAKSRS